MDDKEPEAVLREVMQEKMDEALKYVMAVYYKDLLLGVVDGRLANN